MSDDRDTPVDNPRRRKRVTVSSTTLTQLDPCARANVWASDFLNPDNRKGLRRIERKFGVSFGLEQHPALREVIKAAFLAALEREKDLLSANAMLTLMLERLEDTLRAHGLPVPTDRAPSPPED